MRGASAMVASCKVAVASDSKTSFCECKNVKIEGKVEKVNCGYSSVTKDDNDLKTASTKYGCSTCTP